MKHRALFAQHRFFLTLAFASALSTISGAGIASELEKIRTTGEIVVAHRDASLPFSYLDDNKRPIGYSMDLCLKVVEAIRKELKLPAINIKYLAVTSATRMAAIVEHRASLECGSTTNNAQRRQLVDYSIAHFISSSRFVVKAGLGINTISDLAGRKVVSTKGTSTIPTLRRLNDEQSLKMTILEANDHAEAFAMVSSGAADAFAMDDVLLYGLRAASANPKAYSVIGKPMTIEPYAIMLPKNDPAFKKVVDQEVRRVITSGEIQVLYKKWFESPLAPKGINLELPMAFMLRESFKYPSDKVGDLH